MLLLLSLLSSLSFAAPRELVLVTAFEPFGGRKVNGSALVAQKLGTHFSGTRDYRVCVLPVEYERAAEAAKKCFAALERKPDLVLSTGEGDCTVRAEIRAHNLDDTPGFPDNGGLVRENHVIEAGGPLHQPLALPVPEMVCAARKEGGPVVRGSVSPGYFVCNATAYRLARYFAPKGVRFGFVHLPVAGSCKVSPMQGAEALHKMISAAMAPASSNSPAFAACVREVESGLNELLKKSVIAERKRGDIAPPPAR